MNESFGRPNQLESNASSFLLKVKTFLNVFFLRKRASCITRAHKHET